VPFTLSHAAAAIPFRRTRLVTSALVMGCFAPDFAYFVYLKPHGAFGHSLAGALYLDLPASLLALWLFHSFVRQPLLFFLPGGVRRRLKDGGAAGFSFRPQSRFAMIVLSIVVGIATHIIWDSFTHNDYWPYRHWGFLRQYVNLPITGKMEMDKLLEYGSTFFGLAVLAFWLWHWYRTTIPAAYPLHDSVNAARKRAVILWLPLLTILGGILRAHWAAGAVTDIRSFVHFTADTIVSAIAFFLLGLLSCGVFLRARNPQPQRT
jgi:Domain of unknown function (DUF4184)